jgi:rsbT co-antagonist protein RsbR
MGTEQVGELFEAFFQAYPGALVIAGPEGEVLAANAAASERLAPGARLEEHAHPDDGPAIAAALAHLAEDGAPLRFTCRSRGASGDGPAVAWQLWRAPGRQEIFATFAPAEAAKAPARETAATGKEAAESLVLRAMLDHLDIIAWAVDKEGIFTFHDGKAVAAAGISRGQFVGHSVFDLFRDGISPGMQAALAGEPGHESVEIMGVQWEHWYMPQQDAHGHYAGIVGISQNVNDNQRIREELEARLAVIERQQAVIRDLETPVLKVWDQVLTLPMIGIVDSQRAARVMESLLDAVVRHAARFAILDLTGVEIVDTATASSLMGMIRAIRLLGAEGILTGIRPTVAQTVISLGVDLSGIPTLASLRHGLAYCIHRLEGSPSKNRIPA